MHDESPAAGLGTRTADHWLEHDVISVIADHRTWPPIEDCTLLVEAVAVFPGEDVHEVASQLGELVGRVVVLGPQPIAQEA